MHNLNQSHSIFFGMVKSSCTINNFFKIKFIHSNFQVNPHAKDIAYGNVTDRIELRQKLKCNNFQWYLNNVYPDLLPPESGDKNDQKSGNFGSVNTKDKFVPWDKRERNYEQAFVIKLSNLNLCIQVLFHSILRCCNKYTIHLGLYNQVDLIKRTGLSPECQGPRDKNHTNLE